MCRKKRYQIAKGPKSRDMLSLAGNIHYSASFLAGCAMESAKTHSDLIVNMWHNSEYTFSATNGREFFRLMFD